MNPVTVKPVGGITRRSTQRSAEEIEASISSLEARRSEIEKELPLLKMAIRDFLPRIQRAQAAQNEAHGKLPRVPGFSKGEFISFGADSAELQMAQEEEDGVRSERGQVLARLRLLTHDLAQLNITIHTENKELKRERQRQEDLSALAEGRLIRKPAPQPVVLDAKDRELDQGPMVRVRFLNGRTFQYHEGLAERVIKTNQGAEILARPDRTVYNPTPMEVALGDTSGQA